MILLMFYSFIVDQFFKNSIYLNIKEYFIAKFSCFPSSHLDRENRVIFYNNKQSLFHLPMRILQAMHILCFTSISLSFRVGPMGVPTLSHVR